jgi:hypothetical protein
MQSLLNYKPPQGNRKARVLAGHMGDARKHILAVPYPIYFCRARIARGLPSFSIFGPGFAPTPFYHSMRSVAMGTQLNPKSEILNKFKYGNSKRFEHWYFVL